MSKARIAHAVLVLVGLLVLAYPLTIGAHPGVTCRGQSMQPGDACPKADGTSSQTYEDRAGDARNARPVIAVVGLLLTGFGAALFLGDQQRGQRVAGGQN